MEVATQNVLPAFVEYLGSQGGPEKGKDSRLVTIGNTHCSSGAKHRKKQSDFFLAHLEKEHFDPDLSKS
jgi:hypothetical protein